MPVGDDLRADDEIESFHCWELCGLIHVAVISIATADKLARVTKFLKSLTSWMYRHEKEGRQSNETG